MEEKPLKFGYIEKIPENIREMFTILCQNLTLIQGKWDLFNTLFDSKNSEMLNSLASFAFKLIKVSLFEEVILGICRFGDNSVVCKHKTVSFKTLVAECGTVPDKENKLSDFVNLYEPFKILRDQHIGHTDYEVHIGDPDYHLLISSHNLPIPMITKEMVDKILECSSKLLISISTHYSGADLYFHTFTSNDGNALLYWLNYAFDSQKNGIV